MKKKIAVISMTAVIALTAIFFCYLQFGREMDVGNSFSISSANYKEERINVILNKLVVTGSKEKRRKRSFSMFWIMIFIQSDSVLMVAILMS